MKRTGFRPLYLIPILYMTSLYAMPLLLGVLPQGDSDAMSPAALSIMATPFVLAIANVIAAIAGYLSESRAFLLNSAVLLKYGLVPFFVGGGVLVVIFALSTFIPVPFMLFVGPPVALFLTGAGWVLMASSSAYSIAYLIAARRDGLRSTAFVVVNTLLQFVFVADVVDVMVLTWQEGRWRGLTVAAAVVIGVIAIALLIGMGLTIAGIASTVATA